MKKATRVRFRSEGSKLVSQQKFLSVDGQLFHVEIDVPTLNVTVKSDTHSVQQSSNSLANAKVLAKAKLKEVGVEFHDEVRRKRKEANGSEQTE